MHCGIKNSAGKIAVKFAIFTALCLISARPGSGAERVVTDLAGRSVRVPGMVRRFVALGPGALRLAVYLGALDRVAGIEDAEKRMERDVYVRPYAMALDAAFLELPVVGPGGPGALPDSERLLMCRPDLIAAVGLDSAQLDRLQSQTGIPALCLSYGELGVWRDEARRSLSLLGEVLGRSRRAEEINRYAANLEADLARRTGGIPEPEKPSAYFGGISHKGMHGLASTESGYPPARLAGARNLADSLGRRGHLFIDPEQILAWNPDYIFIDSASRPILEQDFNGNRAFYRMLRAAGAGRIFTLLPYNYYNTNIELALLNAYFIGQTLYPDRFKYLDLEARACEIMEMFIGVRPGRAMPAGRALNFPEHGPVEWR